MRTSSGFSGEESFRVTIFLFGDWSAGFVLAFGESTEGGHDGAAAALAREDEADVLDAAIDGAGSLAHVIALS